jgi:DNA invertase Pin-like site-specific DNA recombinase
VFEEKGVPGKTDLENRPALSELVTALHSNGVKLVLVESLGRLARDLMIQESILHDLKRGGFDLVSVQEPDLCSEDPSRKLMRQVMGAFHEYEKTMIVLKLRGARQRAKARHGKCEGAKPFGYYPGEGCGPGAHPGAQKRGFRVRPHRSAAERGGYSIQDGAAVARLCRQPHPHWPGGRVTA